MDVNPRTLRKDLIKLSVSNAAVAHQLQISVKEAHEFRKGRDSVISQYKQAKLAAFLRDVKRNRESPR